MTISKNASLAYVQVFKIVRGLSNSNYLALNGIVVLGLRKELAI